MVSLRNGYNHLHKKAGVLCVEAPVPLQGAFPQEPGPAVLAYVWCGSRDRFRHAWAQPPVE
eukprot:10932050-Lingulodinium_polyedra.AAC.1